MSRIVLALAVLAAALAVPTTAAQAAKRCPKGMTTWQVQGRAACAPNPATRKPGSGPAAAAQVRSLIRGIGDGPHTRFKPRRPLRRALPRMATQAATLVTKAAGPWMHKADARGSVVATLDETLKSLTLDDGTTVTARSHAVAFEDDSKSVSLQLEASRDGYTIRVEPAIDDLLTQRPDVPCPTADGRVTTTGATTTGSTVTALEGRRVLAAVTEKDTLRYTVHGQVGPDAHLQHFSTDLTLSRHRYERGLQVDITTSATVEAPRDGAGTLAGPPTVDVRIRQAGASAKAERAAERELAGENAHDPDLATALARLGTSERMDLLMAEGTWYDIPNKCAEIRFEPGAGADVAPGQTLAVGGQVTTRDGQPGTGTIDVQSVELGTFGPAHASFDPAHPAPFSATGAAPNDDHATVLVHVIGASTAGRATNFWSGSHDPVKLPARFTGTVASSKLLPGVSSDDWTGTATYVLDRQYPKPDGSSSAIYRLDSASLVSATSTVAGAPGGCRLEAKGSGGTIADGDIEVRVDTDGKATYALLYDVEIPTTYTPAGCPPGGGPPPLDLSIVGFLNSHLSGWPAHDAFRPVGAGWKLQAQGVSDVAAAPGETVSASWDLEPAS